MNPLSLLEVDKLRDFVYDNSNKKLLIGSRGIGKTSTLLLNAFKNATNIDEERDAAVICSHTNIIKIHLEILINICETFNMRYSIRWETGRSACRVTIGDQGTLYLCTRSSIQTLYRHIRVKDVYIDEPNSFSAFGEFLEYIEMRLHWAKNDSRIAIAGSSYNMRNSSLKNLSADVSYNRYVVKHSDLNHYDANRINELKELLSPEAFRTEILCEFI